MSDRPRPLSLLPLASDGAARARSSFEGRRPMPQETEASPARRPWHPLLSSDYSSSGRGGGGSPPGLGRAPSAKEQANSRLLPSPSTPGHRVAGQVAVTPSTAPGTPTREGEQAAQRPQSLGPREQTDYFFPPKRSQSQTSVRSPQSPSVSTGFVTQSPSGLAPEPSSASLTSAAASSRPRRPVLSVMQRGQGTAEGPGAASWATSQLSSMRSATTPALGGPASLGSYGLDVPTPEPAVDSLFRTEALAPFAATTGAPLAAEGPAHVLAQQDVAWPFPGRERHAWWARRWPFVLFGANSLSILVLSYGAAWLERAVYATRPLVPPDVDRPAAIGPDMPRPDKLSWLGSVGAGYAAGAIATAVGFTLSSLILAAFFRDGVTGLNILHKSKGLPAVRFPRRPTLYCSTMFINNGLFFFYRFRAEAMRDHADGRSIWPISMVGATAVAVYVAIQPHSVSASEGLRGLSVARHRRTMADLARFMAGVGIVLYAHAALDRDSTVELRAFLRSAESFVTAVANVAPLSPLRRFARLAPEMLELPAASAVQARVGRQKRMLGILPEHYWPMAMGSMSLLGRLLVGLGAVPAAQLLLPAQSPVDTSLPAPSPALLPKTLLSVEVGFALLGLGLLIDTVATMLLGFGASRVAKSAQFGDVDSRMVRRDWRILVCANQASTIMLVAHRLLQEAHAPDDDPLVPQLTLTLGAVGTGLQFYSLVNLFAWNQVMYGRPRWLYIEEILQGLRCLGEGSWHMWVVAVSMRRVNPLGVEALYLAGAFSFLLGWSIPTGILSHAQMQYRLAHGEDTNTELDELSPSERAVTPSGPELALTAPHNFLLPTSNGPSGGPADADWPTASNDGGAAAVFGRQPTDPRRKLSAVSEQHHSEHGSSQKSGRMSLRRRSTRSSASTASPIGTASEVAKPAQADDPRAVISQTTPYASRLQPTDLSMTWASTMRKSEGEIELARRSASDAIAQARRQSAPEAIPTRPRTQRARPAGGGGIDVQQETASLQAQLSAYRLGGSR